MVAVTAEITYFVQDISDTSRHAGGEIPARRPKHHDAAAGHVFAAVIAHRLDNRVHAAVADAEALTGHAADVGLPGRRPVESNVTDDDVILRHECRTGGRKDNDLAARKTLADVIVGVSLQDESHAARHERSKTLPGGALEMKLDRIVGQPGGAVAAGNF